MGAGVLWLVVARVASGMLPEPVTMGVICSLALGANLGCSPLLMRCCHGDSNLRSACQASRNDAFANIAVLAAAGGVLATATVWPDVVAGTGIAVINLTGAYGIVTQALGELKSAPD